MKEYEKQLLVCPGRIMYSGVGAGCWVLGGGTANHQQVLTTTSRLDMPGRAQRERWVMGEGCCRRRTKRSQDERDFGWIGGNNGWLMADASLLARAEGYFPPLSGNQCSSVPTHPLLPTWNVERSAVCTYCRVHTAASGYTPSPIRAVAAAATARDGYLSDRLPPTLAHCFHPPFLISPLLPLPLPPPPALLPHHLHQTYSFPKTY